MGALENILPANLSSRALKLADDTGRGSEELVLPYSESLEAVTLASAHGIAVLGVDSLLVRKEGLQTIGYTNYDRWIRFEEDWGKFVHAMNSEAESWIKRNRLGEDHGYILTSASKQEFDDLQLSR
jgi:hypothetical protein